MDEGFLHPTSVAPERWNNMFLACSLNLSLTPYIPELSDPLPWPGTQLFQTVKAALFEVEASNKNLNVPRPSHFSLAPAFQAFLLLRWTRQVMLPFFTGVPGLLNFRLCAGLLFSACLSPCSAAFLSANRASWK